MTGRCWRGCEPVLCCGRCAGLWDVLGGGRGCVGCADPCVCVWGWMRGCWMPGLGRSQGWVVREHWGERWGAADGAVCGVRGWSSSGWLVGVLIPFVEGVGCWCPVLGAGGVSEGL